jgi:hypothetical protein
MAWNRHRREVVHHVQNSKVSTSILQTCVIVLTSSRAKKRGVAFPAIEQVEVGLQLSVADVAILWTPIRYAADPSYWNSLMWGPQSHFDATVFQRMRRTSYHLVALLLKACTIVPPPSPALPQAQRLKTLSNDSKLLVFFNSSDINALTEWPQLSELPLRERQWNLMPCVYSSHTADVDYPAFKKKMDALGNFVAEADSESDEVDRADAVMDDAAEPSPPKDIDTPVAPLDFTRTTAPDDHDEQQSVTRSNLPNDPGHQSAKTEECCDEEVVGSDDDWDDDWDIQCWGWMEDPHRFDIEIPMQLGQETGLASPEARHQIQETIGYAHEEDAKIAALVLDKNNSVAEATSRGLMLGYQTPLALGLYAIEELFASNKRAQKVISYEHKKIERNEGVMNRIRTELEESLVNSKIYDGLRQKYLESSNDLSDLRQKQEREFSSSGLTYNPTATARGRSSVAGRGRHGSTAQRSKVSAAPRNASASLRHPTPARHGTPAKHNNPTTHGVPGGTTLSQTSSFEASTTKGQTTGQTSLETGTTGGQTTSANAGTTASQTTSEANAGTTASVGRDPYDATELEK